MNTPAHVVVNLFLLTRRPGRHLDQRRCAAIVTGALVPDLVMIMFYGWQLLLGTSESQIWSVEYYRPLWQAWFDSFNSIPLVGLAMLICWQLHRPLLLVFFSSMMLHLLGDLPVHHDDGHRHFFPFSDWRYQSPVSYWDPAHYGRWFSLFEIGLVLSAAAWMAWHSVLLRPWVAVTGAIYVIYWAYVFIVWA